MAIIRIKRRLASTNDPSPPAYLAPGEIAYNEFTDILYYGVGSIPQDNTNLQNSTLETNLSSLSQ